MRHSIEFSSLGEVRIWHQRKDMPRDPEPVVVLGVDCGDGAYEILMEVPDPGGRAGVRSASILLFSEMSDLETFVGLITGFIDRVKRETGGVRDGR